MEKFKRYIVFTLGLIVSSFGIAMITKARLGTSPISSIPYVLSMNLPFTLGNYTIAFSILLILLQLAILGKRFKLEDLLQLPISVAFGYLIDLAMFLLKGITPEHFEMMLVYLLVGCLILGIGVYMEVLADVAMLPGESFIRAIVIRWNTDFGITKIVNDTSMSVIAIILSYIFTHSVKGVGPGTLIAAILVGFIARLMGRTFKTLPDLLFPESAKRKRAALDAANASTGVTNNDNAVDIANPAIANDIKRNVIVISRQYGCRGSKIGKRLAKDLGYDFYDKDIIQHAAGSTGLSPEFIEKKEEAMKNSLIYDFKNQMYSYTSKEKCPKDAIFEAESKFIREAASKGNCVIVGRLADYILKDNDKCLRIFLHAPIDYRIKNVMEDLQLTPVAAEAEVHKVDKQRADNYRYFTHQILGHSTNYNISIDVSLGWVLVKEIVLSGMRR